MKNWKIRKVIRLHLKNLNNLLFDSLEKVTTLSLLHRPVYILLLLIFSISSFAVQVTDDSGKLVVLESPATRIITLAPFLTELVYSAGAGEKIIATVKYSDYPQSVSTLPIIGDANGLDIESIIAMQPDLVFGWTSGNGTSTLNQLKRLGITLYESEPISIRDISSTIEQIGELAGTSVIANKNSENFNNAIDHLAEKYSTRDEINVFYQFWDKPIYTVGGGHLISSQISFCGGKNIFSAQKTLILNVEIEAVLSKNPAVIIGSGVNSQYPEWLDDWYQWEYIKAVKNRDINFIPPEYIQRHTVRIIEGLKLLCQYIDSARSKTVK